MTTTDQLPPVAEQRQMLEEQRSQFRRIGFSAFMELEALNAQNEGAKPDKKINVQVGQQMWSGTLAEYRKTLSDKIKGAKAAAERMDLRLKELPSEEDTKAEEG